MAIQIRRGAEADLVPGNLAEGELAYCTDSKKIIVSDGENAEELAKNDSVKNLEYSDTYAYPSGTKLISVPSTLPLIAINGKCPIVTANGDSQFINGAWKHADCTINSKNADDEVLSSLNLGLLKKYDSYNFASKIKTLLSSDPIVINGTNTAFTTPGEYGGAFYRSYVPNWCVGKKLLKSTAGSAYAVCSDGNFETLGTASTSVRCINFGGGTGTDYLYLTIEKSKVDAMTGANTLEKFKAYLDLYPINLIYTVATGTTETITDDILHCYEGGSMEVVANDENSIVALNVMVQITTSKLRNDIVLPSDFPSVPFRFWRDNAGAIQTSFDEDVLNVYKAATQKTYYVDKENGLDSNSGATPETAFKTIKQALTVLRVNSSYSKYKVSVIGSSIFYNNELYGDCSFSNKDIIIAPHDPDDRITVSAGINTLTWTKTAGKTYVYQATHTAALDKVIDLSAANKGKFGLYRPYTYKASTAEVDALAGSYYVDGNTIYCRTLTNEAPDNINVLPCVANYIFRFTHSSSTSPSAVILENIDCISGNFYSNSNIYGTTIAKNCTFQNCLINNCVTLINFKNIFMFNCISGYSAYDIYNYHFQGIAVESQRSCLVVEYNCIGYKSGFNTVQGGNVAGINNGTTCHNGASILRIGSVCNNGNGPICADIGGCYSICFDCNMSGSSADGDKAYNNCSFQFDNTDAYEPGKAYLYNCKSAGSTWSLASASSSETTPMDIPIYLNNFDDITTIKDNLTAITLI